MGRQYANIMICLESLKTARLPSEKAGIKAIMKSSDGASVAKLEDVASRHDVWRGRSGYTASCSVPSRVAGREG